MRYKTPSQPDRLPCPRYRPCPVCLLLSPLRPPLFPKARDDVEILRADREKRAVRRERHRAREIALEAEEDAFLDDLQKAVGELKVR